MVTNLSPTHHRLTFPRSTACHTKRGCATVTPILPFAQSFAEVPRRITTAHTWPAIRTRGHPAVRHSLRARTRSRIKHVPEHLALAPLRVPARAPLRVQGRKLRFELLPTTDSDAYRLEPRAKSRMKRCQRDALFSSIVSIHSKL